MTEVRPVPPASVPTLTEVVDAPGGTAAAGSPLEPEATLASASAPASGPAALSALAPAPADRVAPATPPLSEAELTARILHDLQQQVDLVVEYRIRERLTPILERAGDTVVREARAELSRALREVVARAVAAELHRQRGR